MQFTLPNILSLSRLLISFLFFILFNLKDPLLKLIALILFIIGSITDYYDGYIARKYNLSSSLGKFLDPLADKFLTIAAFLSFVIMDLIPLWMLLIIIARDLITTLLRTNLNDSITTSYIAKLKTFLQMVFIFASLLLIIWIDYFPLLPLSLIFHSFLHSLYYDLLMFLIVLLTIWTLIDYIKSL